MLWPPDEMTRRDGETTQKAACISSHNREEEGDAHILGFLKNCSVRRTG